METIGEMLKKRRSEKGISLADAYESTKITMQNLAALEEDRFDAFPNRVYSRAFLRDYANFLGLDSDELLKQYETDWCGTPKPVETPRATSSKGPWKFVAGLGITVIVIAGAGAGGYYVYSHKGNHKQVAVHHEDQVPQPKPKPEPKPTPAPTKPAVPTAGAQPAAGTKPGTPTAPTANPNAPKPTTPAKPATPPAEAVPAGQVKVSLNAVRKVWLRVTVDGEKRYEGYLEAGAGYVTVGKNVKVRVGDGGAVDLLLNGKSKGRFAPGQFAITKTFTPESSSGTSKP